MKNVSSTQRLYRSRKDRVIAGVCGGMGEYFDIDPVWIRIAAILLIFAHGIGIILYLLTWILIPENPSQSIPKNKNYERVKKVEKEAKRVVYDIDTKRNDRGLYFFGFVLILVGTLILFKNIFWWFTMEYVWPVLLIAFGIYLLWRRK